LTEGRDGRRRRRRRRRRRCLPYGPSTLRPTPPDGRPDGGSISPTKAI